MQEANTQDRTVGIYYCEPLTSAKTLKPGRYLFTIGESLLRVELTEPTSTEEMKNALRAAGPVTLIRGVMEWWNPFASEEVG